MRHIRVNLEFSGAVLPVAQGADGRDIVPLKPIADVFGLDWESQRKVVNSPRTAKRLGTSTGVIHGGRGDREMVCIRVDRVAAYLNSINPQRVRAGGNEAGADFLEAKQEEWDDLLAEYEQQSGIFTTHATRVATQRSRAGRDFVAYSKECRATTDKAARAALQALMAATAKEMGVPFPIEESTEKTAS